MKGSAAVEEHRRIELSAGADGVENFKHDLESLVRNTSIDEIKFVLGDGDSCV